MGEFLLIAKFASNHLNYAIYRWYKVLNNDATSKKCATTELAKGKPWI
jgi:hypothetical protein